jgi:hypothetical protein
MNMNMDFFGVVFLFVGAIRDDDVAVIVLDEMVLGKRLWREREGEVEERNWEGGSVISAFKVKAIHVWVSEWVQGLGMSITINHVWRCDGSCIGLDGMSMMMMMMMMLMMMMMPGSVSRQVRGET